MKKICFVASSGGHLEEISMLEKLKADRDYFLITEKSEFPPSKFCERIYYVDQVNRKERLFLLKMIKLTAQTVRILHMEKPDYIISTGALAAYPAMLLGKLSGKKVIYIESFARVDSASLTGKLTYRIADLFIVQWKESLQFFPKATNGGGIF